MRKDARRLLLIVLLFVAIVVTWGWLSSWFIHWMGMHHSDWKQIPLALTQAMGFVVLPAAVLMPMVFRD